MNAGAARATGNILLFLHADTLLPHSWRRFVSEMLKQSGIVAGAFRFRIAEDIPGKRIVEWTTHLRSHWLQKPYGDQAIFLLRSLFEELGGYADLPIMEDYDLVTRLRRRGKIVTADEPVYRFRSPLAAVGLLSDHPDQQGGHCRSSSRHFSSQAGQVLSRPNSKITRLNPCGQAASEVRSCVLSQMSL